MRSRFICKYIENFSETGSLTEISYLTSIYNIFPPEYFPWPVALWPSFVMLLKRLLKHFLYVCQWCRAFSGPFAGARDSHFLHLIFVCRNIKKWHCDKFREYDGCCKAVTLCLATCFWPTVSDVQVRCLADETLSC